MTKSREEWNKKWGKMKEKAGENEKQQKIKENNEEWNKKLKNETKNDKNEIRAAKNETLKN
jgi:hypothetical protein